jgi:hypothetical protein
MPWEGLKDSIDFCRQNELAGHVLWFSRGVLEVYPEQLKAYYDVVNKGHAANPMKPGNWRPMPAVATRVEGNAWKVTLTSKDRYRIIAKQDGIWSEVAAMELQEGENTIVQEAEAVEVLVDRRP